MPENKDYPVSDERHASNIDVNPNSLRVSKRVKVATALTALALGATFVHSSDKSEAPKPETETYTVQEGDTLSEVAEKVALNTGEKETMQEAAENLRELNPDLPPQPDLTAGQELAVPAEADIYGDVSGAQLDHK